MRELKFDLDEVRAKSLPHADCESCGIVISPLDTLPEDKRAEAQRYADETIAAINVYLANFTINEKKTCPGCDRALGGFLGSFTWGICWGEGNCTNCGWPCRAHHKTDDFSVGNLILPYHPDFVAVREPLEA